MHRPTADLIGSNGRDPAYQPACTIARASLRHPMHAARRRACAALALALMTTALPMAFGQGTGTFVDRQNPTDLRILCYNVNWDSIFEDGDPHNHAWRAYDMSDPFVRIIHALEPDIVCLQEINSARDSQDVADIFDAELPLGDGIGWRSYIGSDDVIVSRYDLSMTADDTIPATNRSHAQALVDLPDGQFAHDLYLINAHFKAGGASSDISRRQQHADAIVNWIRDCQNPGGNIDLPADTPIVVLGDLNVYDTDPHYHLTTLVTGDIVYEATYGSDYPPDWDSTDNADALPLHNAVGPDYYTWRDDSSSFNPGDLDHIIYNDSLLTTSHSFVLNTTAMTSGELTATGLQANDVVLDPAIGYYDHFPLVIDFAASAGCTSDPDCSDGLFCNGAETCDVNGACQPGTPVDCSDGVGCTDDSCNEATDSCDNVPNDALCDNGLFCDGAETCDLLLDCQAGTDPCTADEVCDETSDTCEPDCNHNSVADDLDIAGGTSEDCQPNGIPDECEPDLDGDNVPDDCDGCPSDPDKVDPGQCGCGVPDTDSDGDGTADCNDLCPNEPALIEPSEPGLEVSCADGVDNDCDVLTDTADPDCAGPGCPHTCGDIDGSGGLVDLNDFATLANCYGLSGPAGDCDATSLACSDMDGNGTVNLSDFSTFALIYGLTSTNSRPSCP